MGLGPQGTGQFEEHRQGGGGVEVVVEGGAEALAEAGEFAIELRVGARGDACGIGGGGGINSPGGQPEGRVQPLPAAGRRRQGLGGEIQRLAVVGLQHEQPQGHRADTALKQRADGGEVAQGFGHLFAAHIDHAVVQPEAGQRMAAGGLRLGDLVLVVRKDQVGTTQMDVDRVAEFLAHHRRTLDVPSRPSRSPGGGEGGLPRLGAFPEGEVEGMVLAGFLAIGQPAAGALLLLIEVAAAELAVIGLGHHREVNVAIGGIGRPPGLQLTDQPPDGVEAEGGAGHPVGPQDVEGIHIGEVVGDVAIAHRLHGAALLGGPFEDLVVDVGEVLHEGHRVAPPLQMAAQHVPDDVTAGVAQMAEVIDRDTAAVDAHLARLQGHEGLGAPGEGVGQPQAHGMVRDNRGTVGRPPHGPPGTGRLALVWLDRRLRRRTPCRWPRLLACLNRA